MWAEKSAPALAQPHSSTWTTSLPAGNGWSQETFTSLGSVDTRATSPYYTTVAVDTGVGPDTALSLSSFSLHRTGNESTVYNESGQFSDNYEDYGLSGTYTLEQATNGVYSRYEAGSLANASLSLDSYVLFYEESEGVEYHELGTGWREISSEASGEGGGGGGGALRVETFTFTKDEEHEVERRRRDEGTYTDENYNLSSYTFHYHKHDYSSAAETGTYDDSNLGTGTYNWHLSSDEWIEVYKWGTGRVGTDWGQYRVERNGQDPATGTFPLVEALLEDPRVGLGYEVDELPRVPLPQPDAETLAKVKKYSDQTPGTWGAWERFLYQFGGPNHEQPGFLEHLIPGWGAERSALAHVENGEYGWATFEIVLGATELATLGVGNLVTRPIRWAVGKTAKPVISKTAITGGKGLAEQVGKAAARDAIACFAAGTPILTPDGHKNIEELRPGDLVLAAPEHHADGPVQPRVVEATFTNLARLWHLHVGGQVIRTTDEHPFYVKGLGWVATKDLAVGDWLRSHDRRWIQVEDICDTGMVEPVYNCRVAEYHTYFVGTEDWGFSVWAHNLCLAGKVNRMIDAGVPGARKLAGKLGTSGGDFHARRAWHYFRRGELAGIEHGVGLGRRRSVDLWLKDGTRVELKSWLGWEYLSSAAHRKMLGHLRTQVHTYLGGRGRFLRIEFEGGIPGPAMDLLQDLQGIYGPRLWFGAI